MFISCDNKGCFESTEALLNKDTDEVICMNCGKNISSVTSFMKVTLKTLGQVTKTSKQGASFAIECKDCGKKHTPQIKGGKVYCSYDKCGKEMTYLPPATVHMLKVMIGNK
jgi:hypothetical protein